MLQKEGPTDSSRKAEAGRDLWRSPRPAPACSEQLSNTIRNYSPLALKTTLPAPFQHLPSTSRDFGNTMGSVQTPPRRKESLVPIFTRSRQGQGWTQQKTVESLQFTSTKPFQKPRICAFSQLHLQASPRTICYPCLCSMHSSSWHFHISIGTRISKKYDYYEDKISA